MKLRRLHAYLATVLLITSLLLAPTTARAAEGTGFTGRVTDWRGAPVANATIQFWNGRIEDSQYATPSRGLTVTTDSDGRYVYANIPAGYYAINVDPSKELDGFSVQSMLPVAVTDGELTVVDVQLKPAGLLKATVVRPDGRALPEDSRVYMLPCAGSDSWPNGVQEGGSTQAPPGTYKVCITVDAEARGSLGGLTMVERTVTVEPGSTTELGTIRLPAATGTVKGKLRLSGKLHKGPLYVDLRTTGPRESFQSIQVDVTRAKASSTVTFKHVPAGTYRVMVDGANVSRYVTVKSGKTTTFSTFKYKLGYVTGRLSGVKGEYACVNVDDRFDHGNSHCGSGSFTYVVGSLGKGSYRLVVSNPRDLTSVSTTFKVTKYGQKVTKNLAIKSLLPYRRLTGSITYAGNGPEPAAMWMPMPQQPDTNIRVPIAPDGSVDYDSIPSVGTTYQIVNRFGQTMHTGVIPAGVNPVTLDLALE